VTCATSTDETAERSPLGQPKNPFAGGLERALHRLGVLALNGQQSSRVETEMAKCSTCTPWRATGLHRPYDQDPIIK